MERLPKNVENALERLEDAGFEACVVGGCVRDNIMGREISDWDICTSALPEDVLAVFENEKTIPTGIKHGTVTVIIGETPLEITTYRAELGYSDSRRPDNVRFGVTLEEDLSRRDFTCNAIAYSPKRGLTDPFGGMEDIRNGVIRAVGEPEERFTEDALRIMRALRFSAVLGFEIEPKTAEALRRKRKLLNKIAGERIFTELKKLICGKNAGSVIREYHDVLDVVIPGLSKLNGFDQKSPYHTKDALGHTIDVMENVEPDPILRLAALFHDFGKPDKFFMGEDGRGHFYSHEPHGAYLLKRIWPRLKPDSFTRERVTNLVRLHHLNITPIPVVVKRRIRKYGVEFLRDVLALMKADALAHTPDAAQSRLERIYAFEVIFEETVENECCCTLPQLAVRGGDIIDLGVRQGKEIGRILDALLTEVIENDLPNERNILLEKAKTLIN